MILYIILLAIAIVGFSSIFILDETKQAIVIQFGKPVSKTITNAGIHFKIPIIQNVIKFDKRILEWDGSANEIPTKDDKYIFIDAFQGGVSVMPFSFINPPRMKCWPNLAWMIY